MATISTPADTENVDADGDPTHPPTPLPPIAVEAAKEES